MKSLYYNWLKESPIYSLPNIVIASDIDYSGMYVQPQNNEIVIDNICHALDDGLIVIRYDTNESTIAHEFRHHIQYLHGFIFDSNDWNFNKPYKDAIIDYYSNSITEMDALLYECAKSPDDYNMQWLEWIMNK